MSRNCVQVMCIPCGESPVGIGVLHGAINEFWDWHYRMWVNWSEASQGDLSQADFINLLLDNQLDQGATFEPEDESQFVRLDDLEEMESGIRDLLRSFLEFFIAYGLEIGKDSGKNDLAALTERLNNTPGIGPSPRGKRSKPR